MRQLLIASHNPGKVREIQELLAPLHFKVVSATELNLPEPEETGHTFEANAALKALACADGANLLALADDSGLVVPALDGEPGIYSARWAGPTKDFHAAMLRIATELHARGIEPNGTTAYFVCVLALAQPDGTLQHVRGEVHGTLTFPPRGVHGFGYDPIFVADGYAETFGEMDPKQKHAISHRAHAFAQLVALLKQEQTA
ncbi:MAG: RdgB/HAM1 family non-canonical purine NTP pyrophosphatase [Rickettsiales bacterium]